MAIGEFNVDINALNDVGKSLSSAISENQVIKSSANKIDAGLISPFSPSAASNVDKILGDVEKLMSSLNDLETSYGLAKTDLITAYEESKRMAEEDLRDDAKAGQNDIKVEANDNSYLDGLNETIAFYFNYPQAAREAKQLSISKVRSMLEKNGAKKIDENVYQIKIGNKIYKYNVKSSVITEDGERGSLYAKFFATENADFSNITNTITLMGGSGAVDRNAVDSNLNNGVKVNNNSLIILPYGEGIFNKSHLVAGSTRIANFMAGGTSKTIKNSIVGYSLGGQIAAKAVVSNKNLYKTIVFVNSAPYQSQTGRGVIPDNQTTYDAFKNVNIIFLEGSGDNFVKGVSKTVDVFTSKGVPKSNFYIYTNDKNLINRYQPKLGANHVISPPSNYPVGGKKGWRGHSYGFNMIKDSGIISYLGNI